MPRRRTMRATFARPARCSTPLFRPPSTYSPTSISRSSPEHSAKAPLPSAPLAAVAPGAVGGEFESVTRNRKVRANRSSGMADRRWSRGDRGLDRPLGLNGHADDDVLDGLGRGHADFHNELTAVGFSRQ